MQSHDHIHWYSNLWRTILLQIQQSITPLQSICNKQSKNLWYDTLNTRTITLLFMIKATACPLLEDPRRCAYQEWLGGRQTNYPRLWISCYYIVFPVFAICVIRYLHLRRPISREDAHLMYPRYLRVFLYVMIYCPLPHQSLWERLGVSLLCTCVAFSPLCLIKTMFSKKKYIRWYKFKIVHHRVTIV